MLDCSNVRDTALVTLSEHFVERLAPRIGMCVCCLGCCLCPGFIVDLVQTAHVFALITGGCMEGSYRYE